MSNLSPIAHLWQRETPEQMPRATVVSESSPWFESIQKIDVPFSRNGTHRKLVAQLLRGISQLESKNALKVPIADLPVTKENILAALNRAACREGIVVANSDDQNFLYIWKVVPKP